MILTLMMLVAPLAAPTTYRAPVAEAYEIASVYPTTPFTAMPATAPQAVGMCAYANPYGTPPGVPVGPVNCPDGESVDQECATEATEKYQRKVALIYSIAKARRDNLCARQENVLQACYIDDYECRLNNGTDCFATLQSCVQTAISATNTELNSLDAQVQHDVGIAMGEYWADMLECCEEDPQ